MQRMTNVLHRDADIQTDRPVRQISEETGTVSVFLACSMEEALESPSRHGIDVIASDYLLPGMDSIRLLKNGDRIIFPRQRAEP